MKRTIAGVSICFGMSGLSSIPAQALSVVTSPGSGSPVELIAEIHQPPSPESTRQRLR